MNPEHELTLDTLHRLSGTAPPFKYANADEAVNGLLDELEQRRSGTWGEPSGDTPEEAPREAEEQEADGEDWKAAAIRVLEALPDGRWLAYKDLGELLGVDPQDIGEFAAKSDGVKNAWRLLRAAGTISPGFRWTGADRGDPMQVLKDEGVKFSPSGQAIPEQRMRPEELRELLD
ncbi:hypothetical protein [Salininema proteolyticum]|uniref:Alkylated DNA nucleotide flippase Atl1, participates in nucleotide excision repair, Ada-like DNA-binding domain n=1 Tax=Salininema proteolyticum TaxID=1607685 RepID=A0ABV8U2Z8_9ACTN